MVFNVKCNYSGKSNEFIENTVCTDYDKQILHI